MSLLNVALQEIDHDDIVETVLYDKHGNVQNVRVEFLQPAVEVSLQAEYAARDLSAAFAALMADIEQVNYEFDSQKHDLRMDLSFGRIFEWDFGPMLMELENRRDKDLQHYERQMHELLRQTDDLDWAY